jgi:long-chain fatty acid transport protein
MKKIIVLVAFFATTILAAQTGHIMPAIGAGNLGMGGMAVAQPVSVDGALMWNPATLSAFNGKLLNVDATLMIASPTISSTFGAQSGETASDGGLSVIPNVSYAFGKKDNPNKYAFFVRGVSGFGVDYAEATASNNNPITNPGVFGHIKSQYQLMQIGFTWSYDVTKKLAVGISPVFDVASLEVAPNPTATPNAMGYPRSEKATSNGLGIQFGVFYDNTDRRGRGFKFGASYKTVHNIGDFTFKNTNADGSDAGYSVFNMDFPAITSLGVGYSTKYWDFGLDYRSINYIEAPGLNRGNWQMDGTIDGFGWENSQVFALGAQYHKIKFKRKRRKRGKRDKSKPRFYTKYPLTVRAGFVHNTSPVTAEKAFFSAAAPAIIENEATLGLSYKLTKKSTFNMAFQYGFKNSVTGSFLHPSAVSVANPTGALPNTSVTHTMSTMMVSVGMTVNFADLSKK